MKVGWIGAAVALMASCGRPLLSDLEVDLGDPDSAVRDSEPGDPDGGAGGEQLCREVDFLFVIDHSQSMAAYQDNVVANYEVFIDGIEDAIESIETMHIGVITAEAYPHNDAACDSLGGLVVRTGGEGSSYSACGPYTEGANYMTRRDSLEGAFRCAAQVGTSGSDLDTPLAAILSAVSPPLTDPGACNEGFVNPGALLVLVVVTDTYPNAQGVVDIDPYFAAAGIVEAVGGYDDVVVVMIASTEDSPCLNPLAPELEDFAGIFDHSFVGGICEQDYSRLFGPAIEVVKGACPE
ncbi:MAG: VWA domain-containing protein [Myxococcota bacterium]